MDAGPNSQQAHVSSPSPAVRAAKAPQGGASARWWGTSSINLAARQPVAHAIMFYLLTFAAMILFAPCVLVPIWKGIQRLQADEQAVAVVIAGLRDQIQQNNRHIEALESDPQVIGRVARRELNKRMPDEEHIRWTASELAALRLNLPHEVKPLPEVPVTTPPAWVESMNRWLPAWATSDLFAKPPHRQMLLVMAGALLLTAFVLYTPRAETRIRES